jgi:protein-tyrosine phosphatase
MMITNDDDREMLTYTDPATRLRTLRLQGACNFRDFGGYPTMDGGTVRWGRLFRSGVLSRLTTADLEAIGRFDVRMVCDLRRSDERDSNPNPDFGPGVVQLHWNTARESSPIRSTGFARSGSRVEARAAMVQMYANLPFVLRSRIAGAFEGLQRCGEGAYVVHCSAGKDRTGIVAALILSALGVPRDLVIEDYTLTNTAVDLREQLFGRLGTGIGIAATAEPILALSEPARAAILAADADYILASLGSIEARHGSVAAYLDMEIGVDATAVAKLRASLLE